MKKLFFALLIFTGLCGFAQPSFADRDLAYIHQKLLGERSDTPTFFNRDLYHVYLAIGEGGGGGAQDLQSVTDNGKTTSNDIFTTGYTLNNTANNSIFDA